MGQFKPMVKMMTNEPTVILKLKKGGKVAKKADGGYMPMQSTMPSMGMPARGGTAAAASPMAPSMAARRRAMMGKPAMNPTMMKEGGKADMSQDKAMIKKAFKQHDMQEHKGGKGTSLKLKKGGKFATGGVVNGQGGFAKGGIIKTEGQGGEFRNTKMLTSKTDKSPAKTGNVKMGNGGGYKNGGKAMMGGGKMMGKYTTGGVAKGQGGYAVGGSADESMTQDELEKRYPAPTRQGGITLDDGTFIAGVDNGQGGVNVGTPDFFQKYADNPEILSKLKNLYSEGAMSGAIPMGQAVATPAPSPYYPEPLPSPYYPEPLPSPYYPEPLPTPYYPPTPLEPPRPVEPSNDDENRRRNQESMDRQRASEEYYWKMRNLNNPKEDMRSDPTDFSPKDFSVTSNKRGGAIKKAYATGGIVDTGKAVKMPRRIAHQPVANTMQSGTYKRGGKVRFADGGSEDMSKGAYDAHYANEKKENEAMRESILGAPKRAYEAVKSMFGSQPKPAGSVTKTEKSVTVSPGKKRGGSAMC
jgi:hypothetical protein